MSANRPGWEPFGSPQPVRRTFTDGVPGCRERVMTADRRYEERPDVCPVHHLRLDVEVAS